MGGITQTLFGGSNSKAQNTSQSSSGFGALPPAIQQVISGMATSAGSALNPGGSPNSSLFTLPSMNPASSSALSGIENQNYAITPESIQSGINEQMNPYNQSVINQIEQAQNGQESQLKQYLTEAGQFGSNRGMLGASDISQQAANQVGSFLDNQFNTSLQNALTTIPQNNAQSAQGSVQAGQLEQQQGLQNQQAPVSALAALAQILGVGIPSSSQGTAQGTSNSQSNNGIFKSIGI